MDKSRQQNLLKLTAIGTLLTAAALRIALCCRSLQYDELWSLQFFAPLDLKNILFNLALPNNHPLNTLAIKIASAVSDDLLFIRFFPVVCGILLPLPVGFAASAWYKDRKTGAVAALLTAFSAPLIVYSALARGYIIQAFFFALTAAGFACFARDYVKKFATAGFFLIISGGIGTILSVPTGIAFLGALAAAIYVPNYKTKPHKLVICALAAGLICSAIYYTAAFSALSSAQKWSIGGNYFENCGKILFYTGCGTLTAVITAILFTPVKTLALLLIPLLVLLSGAATGIGPVRTYIIFALIFCTAGAEGISVLLNKKLPYRIFAAVLLLIFAGCQVYNVRNFLLPDWKMANVKASATTISVYPANSSYPLLWNLGTDFLAGYQNSVGKSYLDTVRVYAPCGVFNGMDSSFGEKQIQTNLKGKRGIDSVLGEYHCYQLELCSENIPAQGYFLVAYPVTPFQITPPENALRLNPHFESSTDNKGRCALYFTTTPPSPAAGGNIYLIK